jgi:hypothetical protein
MIRLALAIGFLGVFGFIAYVIAVLLIGHFEKRDKIKKWKEANKKNSTPKNSELNNLTTENHE